MSQFTDDDMKVGWNLQATWVQSEVDKRTRHERPHGQMKLMWSNLLGLALVEEDMQDKGDERSIQLVVAGASPGTHMPVLLRQLQAWMEKRKVKVAFYDPHPLDAKLKSIVDGDTKNMSFAPRVFTDKDATRWSHVDRSTTRVVFFSDIRSKIHGKKEHVNEDEEKIAADMQAQQAWVQIMTPDYCMLKFHAPHGTPDNKSVKSSLWYLPGDVYEQAYVGQFSAEYRLFCTRTDVGQKHEYSTAAIERHAFYHTNITRPKRFSVEGVDRQMPYDDAFAAHVAHKAARWLKINAQELLRASDGMKYEAHVQFARGRIRCMRMRMSQI